MFLRSTIGEGMRLMLIGLAGGIACAHALSRFLTKLLYGIAADDLSTYLAVAVLLALVTLLAVYFPARRAATVDPMISLRYQ